MDAVAVACGEHSDARGTLGYECLVVTNAGAFRDAPDVDDACAQAQYRLERQARFDFRPLLDRIIAWVIAIQNHAGTNHVSPSLGARCDGRAVGEVYDAGINPQRSQTVERRVKTLFLMPRLLTYACVGKNLGRSKMCKDSAQFQMFAFCELASKTLDIARRDAQTV